MYWHIIEVDTKVLYRTGKFIAPEATKEPYIRNSANDTEKTNSALLTSVDKAKAFTYEDE